MAHDEGVDGNAGSPELGEQTRRRSLGRLKTALSCSAVAGLVLIGDFVRQADARAEAAAGAKKMAKRPTPVERSRWVPMVPWAISLLSVVALIIVIVATT